MRLVRMDGTGNRDPEAIVIDVLAAGGTILRASSTPEFQHCVMITINDWWYGTPTLR